jgi:excisionase family DNA binding protein
MAGNPPDRLLLPREFAADLRVSQMTVSRLIHDGEIPATRVGCFWRIYESGYREYLIDTGLSPEIAFGMELFGRQWLLTVEEVAGRLHVCKMTIYRLIQQTGQLSAIRITNHKHSAYRIPDFEYDAYLRKLGLADLTCTGDGHRSAG